jgi:hypothetical protein
MTDDDEPTIIIVSGGLSDDEAHYATVDGVKVSRKPFESTKNFKAHLRSLAKKGKDSVIVIGGLPD